MTVDGTPPGDRARSSLAASAATPFRWEVTEHWEWTCAAGVDGEAIFEIIHERSPARLRADLPGGSAPTQADAAAFLAGSQWKPTGGRGGVDDDLPGGTQDATVSAVAAGGPPTGDLDAWAASAARRPRAPSAGPLHAGPRVGLVIASAVTATWPPAAPPGARPAQGSRWCPGPSPDDRPLFGAGGGAGPTPPTACGLARAEVETESVRSAKVRRVRLHRAHHPGCARRWSP